MITENALPTLQAQAAPTFINSRVVYEVSYRSELRTLQRWAEGLMAPVHKIGLRRAGMCLLWDCHWVCQGINDRVKMKPRRD